MPRISEMFAFIAEDAGPEDEGVVATSIHHPLGVIHMPLVGADMARVASLRPKALAIARASGKRIRLVRFSLREELEVIEPGGNGRHG